MGGRAWGLVPLPETRTQGDVPSPGWRWKGYGKQQEQPPFCSAAMLELGSASHLILPQFPQDENRGQAAPEPTANIHKRAGRSEPTKGEDYSRSEHLGPKVKNMA